MKQRVADLKRFLDLLDQQDQLTPNECEAMLDCLTQLNRSLSVYTHYIQQSSLSSDIDVHLKIMQAVEKKEEVKQEISLKDNIPAQPENPVLPPVNTNKPTEEKTKPLQEPLPDPLKTDPIVNTKKIEIAINDKYRIINELFGSNPTEFNAALQQLNSIATWEEASRYLNSLKEIYNWKESNPLVKNFYAIAQRRFS